jgi:hypothetical protein
LRCSSGIADAAESTGTTWPSELIELYEQINGLPSEEFVQQLPNRELFDLERVVQEREMELDRIHSGDDSH